MRRTGIRAGQRLAGLAVTGLLGVVVPAGCSAEGQQASTELPPASSSSAEPTPDMPELGPPDLPMPAKARTRDAAGAEAFLRYYMDVYNHAQRTMDSTYMREFSRSCDTCDRIADDLDMDAAAGYSYEGGGVRLGAISEPSVGSSEAELVFAVQQEALTVKENGRPVEGLSFPPNSSTTDGAVLLWDASRSTWLITQWETA